MSSEATEPTVDTSSPTPEPSTESVDVPVTDSVDVPDTVSDTESADVPDTVPEPVTTDTETFAFQAEMNQLMSLIINTFYSNKDIFLRELVSNASDAIDKIRHLGLKDTSHLDSGKDLYVHITLDKVNNSFIIEDSGIGMTKNDLINNLGTIAKSGTKGFMEAVEAGADISMIGQFGVGFYSAFLVSDKVQVITKHNDDDCYMWQSAAGGSFNISKVEDSDMKRGTKLILHMKDDQKEYLDDNKVKGLVKKHLEYINYPISLWTETTSTKEVPVEEEEEEEGSGDDDDDKPTIEEVDEDEEEKKPKTKTVTETLQEWKELNTQKPIWCRSPDDVTQEEYEGFYKHISNDWDGHLGVKHFSVEGQLEFKSVLFIPKRAPFNMLDQNNKTGNIKLHVRKIFITDTYDDIMPKWLSFISGIVDSEDLPLNISRETLQKSQITKIIRKNLVKKSIELMNEIAEDDEKYNTFYQNFSNMLKMGVHEDSQNRYKLAQLLRYRSSKSLDSMTNLDTYIERMKEDQKNIYYITGDSAENVDHAPFLETLTKKGFEVLYLTDPMDEYVVQQLKTYKDKQLISITKEGLTLEKTDEEKTLFEETQKEYSDTCKTIKDILGDNVTKVVISDRMSDSPCCLVTSEYSQTANMERIMKAQAAGHNTMMGPMKAQKIMEVNPEHKILTGLKSLIEQDKTSKTIKDLVFLLYDTSLLVSGFTLDDSTRFSKLIHRMIILGMDMGDDNDNNDDEEIVIGDEVSESVVDESLVPTTEDSTMEEVD